MNAVSDLPMLGADLAMYRAQLADFVALAENARAMAERENEAGRAALTLCLSLIRSQCAQGIEAIYRELCSAKLPAGRANADALLHLVAECETVLRA